MIYNFSSVSRLVHIAEGWDVIATSNVSFIVTGLKLLLNFLFFLGLLKFCTVGFCGIGSLIDFILISMQVSQCFQSKIQICVC